MEGKFIEVDRSPLSYNEASAEMPEFVRAAQRARDQVADVLVKVKSEYPEWNLPMGVAQSRPV